MKHFIFLSLLSLLNSNLLFGQDKKFNIELSYPQPIGENDRDKNTTGIVELGLKYHFAETLSIKFGASVNSALLINKTNDLRGNFVSYIVTTRMLEPNIYAEIDLYALGPDRLHLITGLGYTILHYDIEGGTDTFDLSNEDHTQKGFSLNLGFLYDITEQFYFKMNCKLTFLDKVDEEIYDFKSNQNFGLASVGLGIRL